MKGPLTLALLFALPAATPDIRFFRYQRPIQMATSSSGQACVALNATVFTHAAPGLADLRLYRDDTEEPYLLHQAAPTGLEQTMRLPINAGIRGGFTVFDAEMPLGSYDVVDLSLTAQNFVATVTVRGSQTQDGAPTKIGSYTIFDLTQQKLGRGTTLTLPLSDYRYLHFALSGPVKPESIQGVRISRASVEKPRYIEVTQTGPGVVRDRSTVLSVQVPAHTPVDRIVFAPLAAPEFYERSVRITEKPVEPSPDRPAAGDTLAVGSLLRIHGVREGRRIDEERLEIPIPPRIATEPSVWTISIDNGDDPPLLVTSARLEMVERDLCWNAQPGASLSVYYGDALLSTPRYNYAALTELQAHPMVAQLGPETPNPRWQGRPDTRPFTERYPWLLWAALVGVIGLLARIALQSAKQRSL